MKGYVYLDQGGNLCVRTQEYIDNEDIGFFQRNRHQIVLVWKFDTESEGSMYELMASFQRRQLSVMIVRDFCRNVKFDLTAFLEKYKKEKLIFAQAKEI